MSSGVLTDELKTNSKSESAVRASPADSETIVDITVSVSWGCASISLRCDGSDDVDCDESSSSGELERMLCVSESSTFCLAVARATACVSMDRMFSSDKASRTNTLETL